MDSPHAQIDYALARGVAWEEHLGAEAGALIRNYLTNPIAWQTFLGEAPVCMATSVRRVLSEAWTVLLYPSVACPVSVRSLKDAWDSLSGDEVLGASGLPATFRPHLQSAYCYLDPSDAEDVTHFPYHTTLAHSDAVPPDTAVLLATQLREGLVMLAAYAPAALVAAAACHIEELIPRLLAGYYADSATALFHDISSALVFEPATVTPHARHAAAALLAATRIAVPRPDACAHCGATTADALAYPCPTLHAAFAPRTRAARARMAVPSYPGPFSSQPARIRTPAGTAAAIAATIARRDCCQEHGQRQPAMDVPSFLPEFTPLFESVPSLPLLPGPRPPFSLDTYDPARVPTSTVVQTVHVVSAIHARRRSIIDRRFSVVSGEERPMLTLPPAPWGPASTPLLAGDAPEALLARAVALTVAATGFEASSTVAMRLLLDATSDHLRRLTRNLRVVADKSPRESLLSVTSRMLRAHTDGGLPALAAHVQSSLTRLADLQKLSSALSATQARSDEVARTPSSAIIPPTPLDLHNTEGFGLEFEYQQDGDALLHAVATPAMYSSPDDPFVFSPL
eukprot:m.144283 g.144283  ORF g.144283 m.144283 type:complete len:569 (-) comp15006_c0_seq5:32-1738(-)